MGPGHPIDLRLQPANEPDEVVLKAGEKVELTENEFVGFTSQIPGIDKVRSVFDGLFGGERRGRLAPRFDPFNPSGLPREPDYDDFPPPGP
jgi:hypothetical protein